MKKLSILALLILISASIYSQSFTEGAYVKSKWGGYWHNGTILKVKNNQYLVHYIGYGPGYDQWVNGNELFAITYKPKSKPIETKSIETKPVVVEAATTVATTDTLVASKTTTPDNATAQANNIQNKATIDNTTQNSQTLNSATQNSQTQNTTTKNSATLNALKAYNNKSTWRKKENKQPEPEKNKEPVKEITTITTEVVAKEEPPTATPATAIVAKNEKQEPIKQPVVESKPTSSFTVQQSNVKQEENNTIKQVAYENKSAWKNTSNTPKRNMINPDYVADKLYLCYTVRSNALDISTIYLGKDNLIRNPKFGVDPVRIDNEKQGNPSNVANYIIESDQMMVSWADGRSENWKVAYSTMTIYGLDGKTVAIQKVMPANYKLNGRYVINGLSSKSNAPLTVDFNYNGGFIVRTTNNIATLTAASATPPNQRGQYSIAGNTLLLKFDSGESLKAVICLPVINGKKLLVINNSYYPLQ